jgi:hypothetical protein
VLPHYSTVLSGVEVKRRRVKGWEMTRVGFPALSLYLLDISFPTETLKVPDRKRKDMSPWPVWCYWVTSSINPAGGFEKHPCPAPHFFMSLTSALRRWEEGDRW